MSNSLLAGILGLDWKDILLHLLNFAILVAIAGGLIYKPVIRFVHARREEIENQEKEHNEKMKEAEEKKTEYAALIGSAEQDIAAKKKEADADAAYAQAKETVLAELRQTFRPEFLNRIDDIIVFRALTEQNIEEVARRMLKTVADRMETMDIHLDASDEAVKELAKEGFDPKYGARPLRRAIQSKVEDAVAEKMLDGTLKTGDTAKLAVEDDKLVVTK